MNTSFERSSEGKDEWLTPPYIVKALGEFDLDPCAPIIRPWDTATHHYSINDDGLSCVWAGRVWLNPPYGNQTEKWLRKLIKHGNGVALTFARTETKMFVECIWKQADAIVFIYKRIRFYHVDGTKGGSAGSLSD